MVDMERIEVLEGPQGTLFGGGAEAGVVRYITNKPKLGVEEGRAEGGYGVTAHGDPNTSANIMLNLPLGDKVAIRGVLYSEKRGGYIDNVPSTFQRNPNTDKGPSAYSSSYPANNPTYNNYMLVQKAQNPTTYQGMRLALLYQINDNWNALIQQTYQNMDAEGMPVQMPVGLGFEQLQPLEETSYTPAWNKDKASITSWTINGQMGFLKGIYTGSYLTRSVDANMDYSNYTRTAGGFYYSCTGGGGSNMNGAGPATCYSPVMGWHDYFQTTHQSHEVRLSTPEDLRLRGLLGFYWEDFQIKDDMNFNQKTIPSCTPENLAAALAGGPICLANVTPVNAAIDPTTRGDNTNFGEDLQRGYKQTAVFLSADFDLIPKVLTLTAGTRYFKYTEQEVGSQYGTGARCENKPNGDPACYATPITYEDHHATFTGFKSRGNLTWHITPDAMVYYTFSQGYRPGAFNRLTGGRTNIWVDAAGVPLANGVVARSHRYQADAVQQTLELRTRLTDQQRSRLQVGVLRASPAGQRVALQDELGQCADVDLQPADLWQHDLRTDGAELRDQGRRTATRVQGDRRSDPVGQYVVQRFKAGHRPLHPLRRHNADDTCQSDPRGCLHHPGALRRP